VWAEAAHLGTLGVEIHMKRATVLTVPSGEQLEASIPGRYRALVTPAMRRVKGPFVVFIFGEEVARLRQVDHAWGELLPNASPAVAFAGDMTVEARTFLEENGAAVCTLRSFGWNEERCARIAEN
jgi:hypothetical protein